MNSELPIQSVIGDLKAVLRSSRSVVLQAEPGAGKTTGVPPALIAEKWLSGRRIVMLEPRRLAARMAARYMAEEIFGENVGERVGYTIRLESRTGPATRIEVVTEGILTRRIQHDPELSDVGLLIFDEFHERGLQADLGLALALDVQSGLREDLRILVMSATLDIGRISSFLEDAPRLTCPGRQFPVETTSFPPRRGEALPDAVVRAVQEAIRCVSGSLLVFLPGVGEINRVAEKLGRIQLPRGVSVTPLYGGLDWAKQKRAVARPPEGQRKIVLATSIAETSLTIEGVEAVVDSGWMRIPLFDPGSGMTRLTTCRVTRDAADQRRGRAGRLGPGRCWRLWGPGEESMMHPHREPEIVNCDLAQLALELAVWGVRHPRQLCWLDPPPAAAWEHGRQLLAALGALAPDGSATPHGREMARLGVPPRIGHMMVVARDRGCTRLGAAIAALLTERDLLSHSDVGCDLRLRLDLIRKIAAGERNHPRGRIIMEAKRQFEKRLSEDADCLARSRRQKPVDSVGSRPRHDRHLRGSGRAAGFFPDDATGLLVASAYPDQIARRRRGNSLVYLLSSGRGACLQRGDSLAKEEFLAVASTDGRADGARIFLAAPIALTDIEELYGGKIVMDELIEWRADREAVECRSVMKLDALILRDEPLRNPDPEAVTAALLTGITAKGIHVLPWSKESLCLRQRIAFMRRVDGAEAGWPDTSDPGLESRLSEWLGPFLGGMRRLADLRNLDMTSIVSCMLPYDLAARLAREAPTHLQVPSGSKIRLDYSGDTPALPVKLQEMFGQQDTPTVAGGKVPVLVQLLSPGRKPVQVTRDMANFWRETYFHVRKELRGRYPKHPWPDDPTKAIPTRKTKKQMK